MGEWQLFEGLMEAWGRSTMSDNAFKRKLDSIAWDDQFYADGENYYVKGNFIFTTPVTNPFDETFGISPAAVFSDGSAMYFYQ